MSEGVQITNMATIRYKSISAKICFLLLITEAKDYERISGDYGGSHCIITVPGDIAYHSRNSGDGQRQVRGQ